MLKRKRLKVKGIVQGVGFRPFVYRLATGLELTGFVRNTTQGVDIEVEGPEPRIKRFILALTAERPRASRIDSIQESTRPCLGSRNFVIKKSRISKGFTQISPDIATCGECLAELTDPGDRRYGFPFINCTNCGPRYSIVLQTPYDRKRTTMRGFQMCPVCQDEFHKVTDRRFHAQPDCCSICGPKFTLYTIAGREIKTPDPILKAAELLKRGEILMIKGIGGFHIACDATNPRVVKRLRTLKNRPSKPFAIMMRSRDLGKIVYASRAEKTIINSPAAPILILKKKGSIVCDGVAPHNPYLGVMAPYAPVHHLLLEKIPYLVMTSANIQDEPIVKEDKEVRQRLGHIGAYYLSHDRRIENRCDDSVGFCLRNKGFSILRRSRGYAPVPVDLPVSVAPTIGVGPYLKNTFVLAHKKEAYVSPHIGDLDNHETLRFFEEMVEKYKKWFRIAPELVVHDLHPDYLSTKLARRMSGKKIAVQHHVAHIVSCLGENNIFDRAIGIAYDGTGFGTDGKIWGGEFFVGDMKTLKRVAHLEYLPLPGGEASIKKPFRIAIAYLYKLLGRKGHLALATTAETETIKKMVDHGYNLADTSSMGRLFDCVAGMLGLMKEITYEAEAAINLEYLATKRTNIKASYPYAIEQGEAMIIRLTGLLEAILRDIKNRVAKETIAARFHNTVVEFSLDIAKKLAKIYGVKKICLSGGVFQNRYLLERMIAGFERAGLDVYLHRQLPTNDGCISYGQVIAGNMMGDK